MREGARKKKKGEKPSVCPQSLVFIVSRCCFFIFFDGFT